MEVQTSRFGVVEIAEDRVITFPRGLLGFDGMTRWCILQPNEDACFLWLQSLDDAGLAFVVTDPGLFEASYEVPIRSEQREALRLREGGEGGAQVLVIVNKVGDTLTGNLQGPLVLNPEAMLGEQLVLADKRWTTRHELMKVGDRVRASA
jgi:flagellar assembly factor FliW